MAEHNRLNAPLPDSVLDRFFAENPDEVDDRPAKSTPPDLNPSAASLHGIQPIEPKQGEKLDEYLARKDDRA